MKSPAPIALLLLLSSLSLLSALVSGSTTWKDRFAVVAFLSGGTAIALITVKARRPEEQEEAVEPLNQAQRPSPIPPLACLSQQPTRIEDGLFD